MTIHCFKQISPLLPRFNRGKSRGFTLLELLVAVSVFALLSVMAYGGLMVMLQTADQTELQAKRMTELQMAMIIISRDLFQATGRSIVNEYGTREAAFLGSDNSLNLTRAGLNNPMDRSRSTLQRIKYNRAENTLLRTQWSVLDRAADSEAYNAPLLKKVSEIKFRYMNLARSWVNNWPPVGTISSTGATVPPPPLPLAVEITLELEDWGPIIRVFKLPRGWT